jgi:hypothetical protein
MQPRFKSNYPDLLSPGSMKEITVLYIGFYLLRVACVLFQIDI